jgi:signal transduction histidine kinase/CheY-like chemotaxis protein
MAVLKFNKFIDYIRLNGIGFAKESFAARSTVYLNTVLFCTWFVFFVYYIVLFIIQPYLSNQILYGFCAISALYLTTFLLTGKFGHKYTRYLFMFVVYGMIAYTAQIMGNGNFNQVFYFAFLPTAYVLFSLSKERWTITIFLVLICMLIFLQEFKFGQLLQPLAWVPQKQAAIRILNLACGFFLCTTYSGFILINTAKKQGKLITQSSSLQTTLDNAMVAIWSINKNYDLLAINKLFYTFSESIFGPLQLKIGQNIKQYVEHENITERQRNHYRMVLNGEQVYDEFSFRDKIYEIRAIPLKSTTGNILGATFSARDVTDIKNYQKELLEAKEAAEKASMARTMFLSNMSHELRTPLNGITGITNLMLDEELTKQQKDNLEIVAGLNHHMVEIINNILDYTKIESGKATLYNEEFNLQKKIEKITKIFELPARAKQIDFKVEINGDADINLITDRTKINQVFINLISNAIKFTQKGSVTFRADIENNASLNNVSVKFSIIDTGIGIKKENLSRIFESFTQADVNTTRLFGGTGLGLTIADKNLKLFGWKLEVESELNKGTTFSFVATLPKATDNSIASRAAGTIFNPLPHIKVLLAEDNAVNQMVVKKFLQKWEIKINITNNGQEAVNALEQEDFDLVLMDLDMPIMDGYEATKIILQNQPHIPVIALTAATFENITTELKTRGFKEVVQKPFVPEQLYNAIKNTVAS